MPRAGVAYIDVVPNMEGFGRDLETGVKRTTSSLGSNILKFGAVAAVGFGAVTAAAGAAFHAFEESEQVAKQTDAVLKSTGNSANVTADEINNLANSLSAKTAIDDEVIQSGENMLLTFKNIRNEAGKGNDVFNQATATLIDLSAAMGTEPKQAAIQLGKALNDPIKGITALTRVGVTFTEQQKEQITALVESGNTMKAQKIILAELNSEFGGSAEAQKTATAAMGVALGNLAETVGGLVAPAFEFLAEKVQLGVTFLQDNLAPALETAGGFFRGLWERIKPVADFVAGKLMDAFHAWVAALQEDIIPAVVSLWNAIKPAVDVILKLTAALWVVVLEVAPVVIRVIGKIIEVFAGIVGAVSDVIGVIVRFGEKIFAVVGDVWDFLKRVGGWIIDKFVAAWQRLGDVAAGIWDVIVSAARVAVNLVIGFLNVLISGFNRAHDAIAFLNPFGGAGFGRIDPIPTLAQGGIVSRPTLALIGEAGPEAVVPLGSGMQGSIVVNFPRYLGSREEVAKEIREELLKLQKRSALGFAS